MQICQKNRNHFWNFRQEGIEHGERFTHLGRAWGRKIRKATVGFHTLMCRNDREALPLVSAAGIMEVGDYQLWATKPWQNLYLSMPIYLYTADSNGFPFPLCFIGLVQILYWLNINCGGSTALKIQVLDFQFCSRGERSEM